MKEKIYVYGTGGHSKVITDIISFSSDMEVAGYIDDFSDQTEFLSKKIIKLAEIDQGASVVIAIGDNYRRKQVFGQLVSLGKELNFPNLIHPQATIARTVKLTHGIVVMAGAVVNSFAVIEDFVIINTNSSVDHDCRLASFSSVAPGATLGGNVTVGKGSSIGLGANIIHGIKIGNDTVIGAGALVTKNMPAMSICYGSPCKKIRERAEDDYYL